MGGQPRATSLGIKLLKAGLSPIIFVLLLELGIRLIGLRAGLFLFPAPTNCLQRSSLLVLEFQPNCTGKTSGTRISTNELGLRGSALRGDGAMRILALGDSCTWGWKVNQDESYPAVLQTLLDQAGLRHRYEVINAGAPGYTSYQGLLFFRERLLALKPAIVIIAFGFNDSAPNGDVELQLDRMRRVMPIIRLDDFLVLHSQLYRYLRWKTYQRTVQMLPVRVPPEKYRRNLEQMVSLAREHGAKVLLLRFSPQGPLQAKYLPILQQVATEMAVPVVTYEGPRLDIVHPTAAGYQKFAAEILQRLEQEHYVQ